MTTRAQVVAAYNNFVTTYDGLLNTAIDVLNPEKDRTQQIITLMTNVRTQLSTLASSAVSELQQLGVD